MSAESWGSGKVYQRVYKNGKRGKIWWLRYYVHGKLHRESSKSTKKSVADRLLRQAVGEVASGRVLITAAAERVTLGEMLTALADDYARKGNHLSIAAASRYLLGHFGEKARAISITRDAINGYLATRRKMLIMRKGAEQPPSDGTLNLEMNCLRRAFAVLVEARRLSRDHAPVMPMLAKSKPREGFLEPADFERLHAALPEHLRDPVRFLYLSGWRVNEMRTLEWRDCELDRDERGAIIGGTIRLRAEHSKNKKPRRLPLTDDDLLAIIARAHAGRSLECPFIFQRAGGRSLGDFRDSWKTARKAAGLAKLLVHDLRRSTVRNLVRAGVPESVAMGFTGHLTRTIFDRYDIVAASDLEAAAAKMGAYVRERAQEQPKVVPLRKTA